MKQSYIATSAVTKKAQHERITNNKLLLYLKAIGISLQGIRPIKISTSQMYFIIQ